MLFFPLSLFGQHKAKLRSEFVETYPNRFQISPYIESKSHLMDLNFEQGLGSNRLTYISNFIYTAGVRVKYKGIGFAVGKKISSSAFESSLGPSDNFGLGFSYVKPSYLIFSRFETYKGFYLRNTDDWLPGYTDRNNAFYQRPDLKTHSWFTGANYFFNHNRFSNPAALFNLERQKKAAIGFVVGGNFSFNRIEADSVLVPQTSSRALLDTLSTFVNTFTLGVQGGLAFTIPLFHKKRFYITSSLVPGYALQWGKSNNGNVNSDEGGFFNGFTNELRLGVGYNAPRWFAAINFNGFGNTITITANERFIVQNAYLRFALGLRIGK